jgi:hypothetical protein
MNFKVTLAKPMPSLKLCLLACILLIGNAVGAQDRGLLVLGHQITADPNFNIGKQYAVIIGIDRYREWPSLRNAVADARRLRRILEQRYIIDEFIELYDQNATAANIRRLFGETLPAKLTPYDSVLVFYAGHGYLDESKTGFWIGSDGSRDIYNQSGWVPNAQLRNFLSQLKAQRVLVIADACFAGDFLNISRGASPRIDNAFFRRALQLVSRQALTSGASETVPDESEFSRQLFNLLERNQAPLLDPYTMYERIRLGVSKTIPLIGSMPGNEQGAAFVLFLKTAAQAPSPPPVRGSTDIKQAGSQSGPLSGGRVEITIDTNNPIAVQASIRRPNEAMELARPLTGSAELAPGPWIIEARRQDDISMAFQTTIELQTGQTLSIAIPALEWSKNWQMRALARQKAQLESRLAHSLEFDRKLKIAGWVSIGVGALATGLAIFAGVDGSIAYGKYQGATDPATILEYRTIAESASGYLGFSIGLAGVSLAVSPFLLLADTNKKIKEALELINLQLIQLEAKE